MELPDSTRLLARVAVNALLKVPALLKKEAGVFMIIAPVVLRKLPVRNTSPVNLPVPMTAEFAATDDVKN